VPGALSDLVGEGTILSNEQKAQLLYEAYQAAAQVADVELQSRALSNIGCVQMYYEIPIDQREERILREIVRLRGPVWRRIWSE
jgi:hypothetical protein